MTISTSTSRIQYIATASQTAFTVPFVFWDASNLLVYVQGALKTLTTDYTVSGGNGATGTVTFLAGQTAGNSVTLVRNVPATRTTDFPLSGNFNIGTLNTQLDKLFALLQQASTTATRSITENTGEGGTYTLSLPLAVDRADKFLAFDGSGNLIVANNPGSATAQNLVKISANDTTPGYLNGKLVAGGGLVLTENNDGSNETLTVSLPAQGSASGKFLKSDGTTASWQSVLPAYATNALKVLRVNAGATDIEWATVDVLGSAGAVTTAATTLTSSSSRVQVGNMATASQSFTLPDATTLSKGSPLFVFHNKGDYPFGIRDSAGTLLLAVAPGGSVGLALYDNSTAAGLWAPDGGRGLDAGFIIGDNTYSSTYTSVSTPQVALSATKSAHFFRDSSGQPYVSIVDHSTYPATFGTATLIKAANTAVQNAFMLSASKLVVSLADNSVFNIAVSGTTPTPSTSATSAAFGNSTFTTIPTAVNLGSSLILAAYSNAGTLTVQAVDCSGTNPSAGTAATGSATIKQICGVFATSATAAIILYIDDSGSAGSPYSLRALVASTSGTTVTLNTSAGLNDVTADPGAGLSCCAVAAPGSATATAFAMAYMNTADNDIYLVGITVSGTTVSFGAGNKAEAGTFVDPAYSNNNASRFNPNLFGIDSTHVLFTYSDNSAQSRHVVATLSGTTFSFGTPLYGLWTAGTGYNFPQSATGFMCVDLGTSIYQIKNVTISGTTLSVVGTEAVPFNMVGSASRIFATSGGYYGASYVPTSGVDRGRLLFLKRRANGRPQITGTFSLNDATWPSGMPIPVELASNRVGFQSTSLRTSDGASANYVRVVIVEFPSLGAAN